MPDTYVEVWPYWNAAYGIGTTATNTNVNTTVTGVWEAWGTNVTVYPINAWQYWNQL